MIRNVEMLVSLFGCSAPITLTLAELHLLAKRAGETGVSLEMEIHGLSSTPPATAGRVLSFINPEAVDALADQDRRAA